MKRSVLVRHLEQQGCELLREGARHSVFVNRATKRTSTVPRHREINDYLATKICRDRVSSRLCSEAFDARAEVAMQ